MNDRDEGPGEPRRVTVRDRRRVSMDAAGPPGSGAGTAAEGAPAAEAGVPASVEAAAPAEAEELAAARAQAAEYLDSLQRLKAEFDNSRKRIAKEQVATMERAAATLVHRLLPVLDNFELAVASAEEAKDFERMLRGIEMVFGELREVLAQEGLERINAKGNPFDPNLHEAALQVDGGDGEPLVADELRTGYLFKGRVLRPAMVKVIR